MFWAQTCLCAENTRVSETELHLLFLNVTSPTTKPGPTDGQPMFTCTCLRSERDVLQ